MPKSLRGKCLVAAKHLRDPNFYKTTVLIVEHNSGGAMGLVTNRPSGILVRQALTGVVNLPEIADMVYIGGPVEPAALFLLHGVSGLSTDEPAVAPGLYLGNGNETFEQILLKSFTSEPRLPIRVFSGCAGWGPNQIEGELGRGDWHVIGAAGDLVFGEDPYSIYDLSLDRVRQATTFLPPTRQNPELN
jgi:putative transcriptional regulator